MRAALRWLLLVFASAGAVAIAAERARPPEWSRDVVDAFFDDARTKLEGPRPDYSSRPPSDRPASGKPASGEPASAGGDSDAAPPFSWSQLMEADTLETEIKRLSQSLNEAVRTPGVFKGGGYRASRRDFSELAVLFAVTGQYDGPARWKDVAAAMRDRFARAGLNAKVGSDASYREAVERKADLAALVRGDRPPRQNAEDIVADWSQLADRSPLMQRIEMAHDDRLAKWLADPASFRRHRDEIRHEAQVLALLAEVIHREAYEYWDDETFAEYATTLRQAATDMATAAASDDFDQARDAANRATGACTDCHAGYRE